MRSVITAETVAAIVGLVLLSECGRMQTMAGGTSTSENGRVTGHVVDSAGKPEKDAVVEMIPAAYNPVKDSGRGTVADTTDEQGRYSFDSIATGIYNIQAFGSLDGKRLLVTDLPVAGDSFGNRIDTLLIPGSVQVMLPDDFDPAKGYVYVLGTTIMAFSADAVDGRITLDSIAAGTLPAMYYDEFNGAKRPSRLNFGVQVASENLAKVGYCAWDHVKRLYFNTTVSGADVAGNVYGFPTLVRLSNVNFNFSEASGDGRDLRFAKPDNTPLPYEIEQWDSAKAQAAVWVRIDTVYGKTSDHYVRMHWGNPAAQDNSMSPSVFDTADGFQAVWHMQRTGSASTVDATFNHFDATAMGAILPFDTAGYIGLAQRFDGAAGYLNVPNSAAGVLNFPEDGYYSLSAWVMTETLNNDFHFIVSKGNESYGLQINKSNCWEFFEFQNNIGWDGTYSPATPKTWTYLAGVRAGKKQYFYVNGQCVDSTIQTGSGIMPRITTRDICIGKRPMGSNDTISLFNGIIDEVCIANRVFSPDRVKLSFMNQKQNSLFIIFK